MANIYNHDAEKSCLNYQLSLTLSTSNDFLRTGEVLSASSLLFSTPGFMFGTGVDILMDDDAVLVKFWEEKKQLKRYKTGKFDLKDPIRWNIMPINKTLYLHTKLLSVKLQDDSAVRVMYSSKATSLI